MNIIIKIQIKKKKKLEWVSWCKSSVYLPRIQTREFPQKGPLMGMTVDHTILK